MLGSAIPRRWIISLTLVGLVSIVVAAYSALGAAPVFAADSEGTGPGTGSGTSLPVEDTLNDAQVPQGIVMLPGDQRVVSVNLIGDGGGVNNNLPDITYSWGIASGSGVSIVGSNNGRSVIVRGDSTGTAVLEVEVRQGESTLTVYDFKIRQTSITVAPVPPTAVPTVAPTNPGPVPASIPNSQGVVAPEGTLLLNPSGVQTGTSPEKGNLNQSPVIFVEKGSVRDFFGLNVSEVDPSTLPALPPGVRFGDSAADITFVNESGVAQTSFRLVRSAQVCMPVSTDDLSAGFQSVSIYRWNSVAEQWVRLNTTYNALTNQVCARSSNFSIFAVGVSQVLPTPTPGNGELPVTGGWSPTAGLLIFAALVGFVLLGGGAMTMRRARRFDTD